ncbi:MAG: amidohydrolase [Spirochaetaceae bacterium]|jgi:amidohydrolase|nr:amidohydrolase [Spirochaetaceae bacterium]
MSREIFKQILEEHFKYLHRHPELSHEERETTAYIRKILTSAGVEILPAELSSGLVARIKGRGDKVVALRADIDALKITEESGLEYASENPSVMHACGHDFHTTALIGAALLLAGKQREIAGDIKFIFQSAEESTGGAEEVLKSGALDDVDEIYGLHCAPDYQNGLVALCPGETFATSIEFTIRIQGSGGHAALPHKSRDPVVAAAALITLAQTIVSRNSDPFDQLVLGFSRIEAGKTWNIIPDEAYIEGTIRTLAEDKAKSTAERLAEICKGIELTHAVSIELHWWIDAPPTNNDPLLTEFVANTARKLGIPVGTYTPTMMGEDFGFYQKKIRGVFFNFGLGSPYGLHTSQFTAPTDHLPDAAELLAALATDSLSG